MTSAAPARWWRWRRTTAAGRRWRAPARVPGTRRACDHHLRRRRAAQPVGAPRARGARGARRARGLGAGARRRAPVPRARRSRAPAGSLRRPPGRRAAGGTGGRYLEARRAGRGCGRRGAAALETVDRTALWRALTPQMFRYGKLCAALDAAQAAGRQPSDEAQALEWLGARPRADRRQSHQPQDHRRRRALPWRRRSCRHGAASSEAPRHMRIGFGTDVHAFGPGDFVMLGGVRIAHTPRRRGAFRRRRAAACAVRCAAGGRRARGHRPALPATPIRAGGAPTARCS